MTQHPLSAPATPPPPYFLTSPLSNTIIVVAIFPEIFVYGVVVNAQTWEVYIDTEKLYRATLMVDVDDQMKLEAVSLFHSTKDEKLHQIPPSLNVSGFLYAKSGLALR